MTKEQLDKAHDLSYKINQLTAAITEIEKIINASAWGYVGWKTQTGSEFFDGDKLLEPPQSVRNFLFDRKNELEHELKEAQEEFDNL